MLRNLSIDNYAIIDHLEICFESGLNIITGQTGAGKSILLGALGVLSGEKVDAAVLLDKSKNAVVEADFEVGNYSLQGVFKHHELDYSDSVVIRRVILPNGKSRAFINDVPVTQSILKDFAARLIDIHSQHQSLLISHTDFQIKIIDSVGKQIDFVEKYKSEYLSLRAKERHLKHLEEQSDEVLKRKEHLTYMTDEIELLKVKDGEIATLDEELKSLTYANDITTALGSAFGFLDQDEIGVVVNLKRAVSALAEAKKHSSITQPAYERLNSAFIEIKDITDQIQELAEKIELNPDRLSEVELRLDAINTVLHKHGCANERELIDLNLAMSEELEQLNLGEGGLDKLRQEIEKLKIVVVDMAQKVSAGRKSAIPNIEQHTVRIMNQLGIKDTQFKVDIKDCEIGESGADAVEFLFSANVISQPMPIAKVASGGEIARLMLALKGIVSRSVKLPTIIFDEIDTGVSGSIADKMGEIICFMGTQMQVINITHLPQVASKGEHHFYVYKDKQTSIKKLDKEERIEKIAEMLSGANITDAAREQARVLLSK